MSDFVINFIACDHSQSFGKQFRRFPCPSRAKYEKWQDYRNEQASTDYSYQVASRFLEIFPFLPTLKRTRCKSHAMSSIFDCMESTAVAFRHSKTFLNSIHSLTHDTHTHYRRRLSVVRITHVNCQITNVFVSVTAARQTTDKNPIYFSSHE